MEKIGILHPGEMGISIAVNARSETHPVYWASEGRSEQTRSRAQSYVLNDLKTLAEMCRTCSIILSVCPPHAAEDVASQVAAQPFRGLYADLNAISPQRAIRIGNMMRARGIDFVDGGIIGGPAWDAGETWLYLSGSQARRVAECFIGSLLQAEVIGMEIGSASALKMCYAAYSKGTTALLCAILAVAEDSGVYAHLIEQWRRDGSELAEQAPRRTTRVTSKAWRFAGEMEEITATFSRSGLPDGFHQAAAEVYRRMAGFHDRSAEPRLTEVIHSLLEKRNSQTGVQ